MLTLFPRLFRSFALCMTMLLCVVTASAQEKAPVLVSLDGEFGLENSLSAQAIESSCTSHRSPRLATRRSGRQSY